MDGVLMMLKSLLEDVEAKIKKQEEKFEENKAQSEQSRDTSLVALYTSRAMNHATFGKSLGTIANDLNRIIVHVHSNQRPFNPVQEFKSGLDCGIEKKNAD